MTTSLITYDSRRFEELLLHVAEKSVDDPHFGKTKLNKILYYIDFRAYLELGRPVTGAEYRRNKFGPVPSEITSGRNALLLRGDATVEVTDWFGREQERLVSKRSPNLAVFSAAEKEIIDEVLGDLREMSATEVSEMSHADLGWQLVKNNETIPYAAAFLSSRSPDDAELRRGLEIQRILDAGAETLADVARLTADVR